MKRELVVMLDDDVDDIQQGHINDAIVQLRGVYDVAAVIGTGRQIAGEKPVRGAVRPLLGGGAPRR